MRGWFHRFLQLGSVLTLLAVALQGGAVCAVAELAAGHAMTAVAMAHHSGLPTSEHRSANDHLTDVAICKQLCLPAIILPFAGQLRTDFPRMAAQPLTDEIDMPSLRPDVVDRPPKSMV